MCGLEMNAYSDQHIYSFPCMPQLHDCHLKTFCVSVLNFSYLLSRGSTGISCLHSGCFYALLCSGPLQSRQAQTNLICCMCCINWLPYWFLIISSILALKFIWSCVTKSASVFLISVKYFPFTPHLQLYALDIGSAWDSSYIDLFFFMNSSHLYLLVMLLRHLLLKILI